MRFWLDNPDAAESNDKHIKDGLQKQKDGKGHWKPELASDSEEAVRSRSNAPLLSVPGQSSPGTGD